MFTKDDSSFLLSLVSIIVVTVTLIAGTHWLCRYYKSQLKELSTIQTKQNYQQTVDTIEVSDTIVE